MKAPREVEPSDACVRTWDVVVAGAGPGGAMAALSLARRGCDVLVVDRATFPRPKVCGGCLTGGAMAALGEVGLADLPERLGGRPFTKLRLVRRKFVATLPLTRGVAVSREAFDAALVSEAAAAGAAFLPGVMAEVRPPEDALRRVFLTCGERRFEVHARVVVAATGLGGRFGGTFEVEKHPRSWVGAGAVAENGARSCDPGIIYMGIARGGYVGIVRLERNRLGVAAALEPERIRSAGGLGRAGAELASSSGLPGIPNLASLPWKGTPELTRRRRTLAAERLFVLGDAAGFAEPFTGEGIAWAMSGALALAPLVQKAVRGWDAALEGAWERIYSRTIGKRLRLCRMLTRSMRLEPLAGAAISWIGRFPSLASPLVRTVGARIAPA